MSTVSPENPSETNSAVDTLFGYTGRMWDDDTGQQNNLNRWYDPTTGRWISEDPIGFAADDPNLSRYIGNNVTGAVDPSGFLSRSSFQRKGDSYEAWVYLDSLEDYEEVKSLGIDRYFARVAKLITGDAKDGKLVEYDKERTEAKNGVPHLNISRLLEKLEEQMRNEVVAATEKFNANMTSGTHYQKARRLPLTAAEIEKRFFGTDPCEIDCRHSAAVMMARGLYRTIGEDQFDRLYRLTTLGMTLDLTIDNELLIVERRKGRAQKRGDWVQINNDPKYPLKHGEGAGAAAENVIKVGRDSYWGFPHSMRVPPGKKVPNGPQPEKWWENYLIGLYNKPAIPQPHNKKVDPELRFDRISSVPGMQSTHRFLNVAKIAEHLFDLNEYDIERPFRRASQLRLQEKLRAKHGSHECD